MGAALLNTRCEEIAESDNTPLHVGSLVAYTQGMMETITERGIELRPGDVLHPQPPVQGREPHAGHRRHRARLPRGRAHRVLRPTRPTTSTSAARYPGAAIDLIDMYAEGTIFNATFIVREGVRDDNMWHLFTDNTRVPREVMGDLACQIASAQHGVRRLEGLVEKHSWPVVRAYSDALIDYAERMLRAEIAKIPDGTYHAEGWLDDDGVTRDVPERLHVAVIVDGRGRHRRPHRHAAPAPELAEHALRRARRSSRSTACSARCCSTRSSRTPTCRRTRAASGRSRSSRPRAASSTRASPRRRRSASTRPTGSPTSSCRRSRRSCPTARARATRPSSTACT